MVARVVLQLTSNTGVPEGRWRAEIVLACWLVYFGEKRICVGHRGVEPPVRSQEVAILLCSGIVEQCGLVGDGHSGFCGVAWGEDDQRAGDLSVGSVVRCACYLKRTQPNKPTLEETNLIS